MAEPTLKEIEQVRIDPEIATGEPAVVYDNKELLNTLNDNARLKQQNDWNKYQQFLKDYETRLASRQDILDKEVADSDREYLKNTATELFSSALDNPYEIYSPEFNSKLGKLRADAVSSKMARDYAEENVKQMYVNPELNTEENQALVKDYLDNQTVEKGGRKTFMLGVPDIFDTQGYFKGLKDATKESIDASYVSPDNQFIHERQDTKYKYKPFLELIRLGYDSNPKIQRKAKRDFESLPENIKRNFEDPRDYWVNFGSKHFGAYDDITEQGKENIQANPNYLKGANLAEDIRHNKAAEAIDWAQIDLAKEKSKLSKQTAQEQNTWLNSFVNGTINNAIANKMVVYDVDNGVKTKKGYDAQVSNPTLEIFSWKGADKDGKSVTVTPDRAIVSPDGTTISFDFYVKDNNGKIKKDKEGNNVLDKTKTKVVSKEEFKARVGKDLLGVKTLADEIYPYGGGGNGQQSNESEIPTVTSQADYDKLQSGQVFIENGVKYKKP